MTLCHKCGEERGFCKCRGGFVEWFPEVTIGTHLRQNLENDPAFAKAFGEMMRAVEKSVAKGELKL